MKAVKAIVVGFIILCCASCGRVEAPMPIADNGVEIAEALPEVLPEALPEAAIDPKDITGLWHGFLGLAAGYDDRYAFFEDGTFIFANNEMDGITRERAYSGSWEAQDGRLTLTIKNKLMYVGGNTYPPFASVATEYEIIDGQIVYTSLSEAAYEVKTYQMSDVFICEDNDPPIKSVFIKGRQFWDFSEYKEMLDRYISHRDYTDTFDYNAAAQLDPAYISGESTDSVDVFDFPYIIIEDVDIYNHPYNRVETVTYHMQAVRADLDGDGDAETIQLYYGVNPRSTSEFYTSIKIRVDDGLRQSTLSLPLNNWYRDAVRFIDIDSDGRLAMSIGNEFGGYVITRSEAGELTPHSVLGAFISWGEGRMYTAYNRLLDEDETFVSYFDLEKGLMPYERELVAGKELSFPFGVLLLKEKNNVMFVPGALEYSVQRDLLLKNHGDNILAEIPAGEKLKLMDVQFISRGEDGYEVFPWIKVEASDGRQGWIRIIDN